MIRSLIIEDEVSAQKLLASILQEHIPTVSIIGVAGSVKDAQVLIESLKPDLVFLDIELDDGNAFDLLERIEHRSFKLIFITAYDKYALKAFEYEAIDYIVKPYSPREIVKAVSQVEEKPDFHLFRDELIELLKKERYQNAKITISNAEGIDIIRLGNIIRLEGDRSYCRFFTLAGEKIMVSKPLKDFENQLPIEHFFRVHQSHLINLNYVKKVSNEDGGYILMSNGDRVPLAKRRKKDFLKTLEK